MVMHWQRNKKMSAFFQEHERSRTLTAPNVHLAKSAVAKLASARPSASSPSSAQSTPRNATTASSAKSAATRLALACNTQLTAETTELRVRISRSN